MSKPQHKPTEKTRAEIIALRSYGVPIKEVAALPNGYPVEAMRSGQLNVVNKLGFVISTKYPTIDNPFEDEVAYAKKVLDGIEKDDTVFALLYEPDKTSYRDWETS